MNGSLVIENIAGTESTANITSVNSITKSTTNKAVTNNFPFLRVKKLPLLSDVSTGKNLFASLTI